MFLDKVLAEMLIIGRYVGRWPNALYGARVASICRKILIRIFISLQIPKLTIYIIYILKHLRSAETEQGFYFKLHQQFCWETVVVTCQPLHEFASLQLIHYVQNIIFIIITRSHDND